MVFQTNLNLSLDSPDGYITQLDKFGNIQQVPINFGEAIVENEPNPLADFMSTDILAKPFNFVSGNVSKSRFNPFRKKSGLLNVPRYRFHQPFTRSIFWTIICSKPNSKQRKAAQKTFVRKCERKMLMKLTASTSSVFIQKCFSKLLFVYILGL